MIRRFSIQGLRGWWYPVVTLAAAIVALAWIAGCSTMSKSSPPRTEAAQGGGVQAPNVTLPPPAAPVREWAYSEPPAVPAGMKPFQLLKNLTFVSGSSLLSREGQGALIEAVKDLKANTLWHVLAVGFTDNRGEGPGLADLRAAAVKKFLQSQGISADRISVMGLGSKYAKGREYEPGQQALDRRVEVWAFMK